MNQKRLSGSRPDLPTYSIALEALIAWEEKFSPAGALQMHISTNFGPRARSVTFGGLRGRSETKGSRVEAAAAVEEIDLGDSHFSHVRLEAKGAGRAQAVISTEYFDSSLATMGEGERNEKPLILEASISEQGRNSFVVRTCQRYMYIGFNLVITDSCTDLEFRNNY